MVDLLETDALFVTVTQRRFNTGDCLILDGDEALVATVRDRAGLGRRLRRGLARTLTRYEWDVLDRDGSRVLGVVSPLQRLRAVSPTVSLADGSPLGRAVADRTYGVPLVTFERSDGTTLGEMVPSLGDELSEPILWYRVHAADGTGVGTISQQTRGGWGFHLSFEPGADLAVRALVIGYVLHLTLVFT